MDILTQLIEDRRHKARTLDDLANKVQEEGERNFTPTEIETYETLTGEIADLDKQIAERKAHEERISRIEALNTHTQQPTLSQARTLPMGQPTQQASENRAEYPAIARRVHKLRAFPNTEEGERQAFAAGKWLQAMIGGSDEAYRWCVRNGIGSSQQEMRIQQEKVNTTGGALVPDILSSKIVDNREAYGTIRQHADIVPMTSETLMFSQQTGQTTAYFVGEGDSTTESDPSWKTHKLVTKKLKIQSRISEELNDDAIISLTDRFASDAAYSFALKEDQCGFDGDGTSTYGGIVGIRYGLLQSSRVGGMAATSGDDQFALLIMSDFHKLMSYLPAYAVPNAKWFCSHAFFTMVFQRLAEAGGGQTFLTYEQGIGHRFLGYPVVISAAMPSGTTTVYNALIMCLFGDMKRTLVLGDRNEIRISRTDDRYWDTDEIGLKATERIDMIAHSLGDSSTAGPMVGIKGTT